VIGERGVIDVVTTGLTVERARVAEVVDTTTLNEDGFSSSSYA
jgi:hypothetical protein